MNKDYGWVYGYLSTVRGISWDIMGRTGICVKIIKRLKRIGLPCDLIPRPIACESPPTPLKYLVK